MPLRDSAPLGAPCWIELFSSDTARAQDFYGELLGWTAVDAGADYNHYINFSRDGVPIAGGMKNDGSAGMPDGWFVYLATDDIDDVAAAATANGGQVVLPPMKVMELGSMTHLLDAGGAGIGAWQSGLHRGFGVLGEVGTPNWFELHTRDYDASVSFYRQVFGWDTHVMSDDPGFRYTTFGEGDGALAGIMDATAVLPEGAPAGWSIYFGVEDTDAALARTVEMGGSIVMPADDSPFGRLAQATDPTGASFRLVSGGPQ